MNNSQRLRMCLFVIALLTISTIVLIAYTRASQSQKKPTDGVHTYEAAKVKAAPEVVSRVKGLEISGVRLINKDTPQAMLVIEVTNNRDQAVMAVDFTSEVHGTYGGILIDGLLDAENPLVIIPPHSLKTFDWPLTEILEDATASLAAAVFADGKEEGDKRSLEGIKRAREDFQKKKRADKAKNGGQL